MPEQTQKLEKFGRWSVIENLTPSDFLCQCECGRIKKIKKYTLVSGASKSCGKGLCHSINFHTHKLSNAPEYECWQGIKRRVFNKGRRDYKHYGGRGIKMHEAWVNDFKAFYEHVGPRPSPKHSLDRIDNNGNYEPGNVRWVTIHEQAKNRRLAYNVIFYVFNGKKLTLSQLANETGVSRSLLKERIQKKGWSIEDAIKTPKQKRGIRKDKSPLKYKDKKYPRVKILKNGKDFFRTAGNNAKFYDFNGQLVNLTTLSELTKISRKTLKERIQKNKWSVKCATVDSKVPFQGDEEPNICGCAKHKYKNGKPKRVYLGKKPGPPVRNFYNFRGRMMSLSLISEITGINKNTLRDRFRRNGWFEEKTTKPSSQTSS